MLGPEHRYTAASLNSLATLLDALGRREEAAAFRTRYSLEEERQPSR